MSNVKTQAKSIFDLAPVRAQVADIPVTLHVTLIPFDGRGKRDSFRFDLDSYGTLSVYAYGDAKLLDGLEITGEEMTWATQDAKRLVKGTLDARQGEHDGFAVYVTMPMGVAKALPPDQRFVLKAS